jgi:anti-sigma B factor antagonist
MMFERRDVDDVVILDIKGQLTDGSEADDYYVFFKQLSLEGKRKVLINLADVDFLNSSGIGIIVQGYTMLAREGGRLALADTGPRIDAILRVTQLGRTLEIYDTEQEAVESLTKDIRDS